MTDRGLARVAREHLAEPAEPEQLPLAPELAPVLRAPGRPPGAQNHATRSVRAYLAELGADPTAALVRLTGVREEDVLDAVDRLRERLRCTHLEAWDRWWQMFKLLHGSAVPQLAALKVDAEPGAAGALAGAALLHLAALRGLAGEGGGEGLERPVFDADPGGTEG